MSSSHGGCSHHGHGSDGHICGATPGSGVTQTLNEMRYQRGVWGAVMDGDFNKLQSALEKIKHEVKETDPSGFTPLHYAARSGKANIVKALLDAGAVPDAKTKSQEATALQRAAYMGHVAVVEVLIASGASLDLKDSDGCTALHKASAQGHEAVVKILISSGATQSVEDNKGRTAKEVAKTDSIAQLLS